MTLASPLARRTRQSAGRLPDFLVIGATKCGTTSLHHWLARHPEIYISPWKEMRFFLPGYRWEKGLDWYADQFADAPATSVVGECSNGYGRGAEHVGVPQRIAGHLPDVRLIYLIREPMARLRSHYRHRIATGKEWRSPDAAIDADTAYVDTGRYGAELARWHDVFPAERILVLRSEHLFADPQHELARLAAHLGVAPQPGIPLGDKNRADRRNALPRPIRRLIAAGGAWHTGKRLGRAARHLPGLTRTSDVQVDLSPDRTARLHDIYEADRARLRTFLPDTLCDWNLT